MCETFIAIRGQKIAVPHIDFATDRDSVVLPIHFPLHPIHMNTLFKTLLFAFILCLLGMRSPTSQAADLPNHNLTPGAINSSITQSNIHQTVCQKGWTKTVRPPVYFTNKLKKEQIFEYGYPDTNPRDYEEDHLIPLSAGGNPTDRRNLWPQPRNAQWNAAQKDRLEFALYMAMCHDEITLSEVRHAFADDWIAAYKRYGHFLHRYQHGASD
jgi:hypothetical protein